MHVTSNTDIVDDYYGTTVADPFRGLEDSSSAEMRAWEEAQNRVTGAYLAAFPERAQLKARFTALFDYPRYGVPEKHGPFYFFAKNEGLQNQAVLYRQDRLDGAASVVLDPNQFSADGTVALTLQSFSVDGALLAYATSGSGSDRQEIRIRDVQTGKDYPEVLRWCKFTNAAWKHDGSGFYYNRFPEPGTVPVEDENNYERVYWHALGTSQDRDVLVFEYPESKELGFVPFITDDGMYLMLSVYHGTDPRRGLYVRSVASDGLFIRLLEHGEAAYNPVDTVGSTLYVQTDLHAPHGRIVAIDLHDPARAQWRELVPQSDDVIHFATMVHDHLVLLYLHNAHHRIALHDLQGRFVREIGLPTLGAVVGLSGKRDHSELFIGFTSFLYPTTPLRYDFLTEELRALHASPVPFDVAGYETTQVFATSRDGTRISMFLTHKRGLVLDGRNPTLLYGYGGFNASLTPSFSVSPLPWLESGGIYAVANLRGGGEYGEEWHRAGMLERKQNVFDDFIACAEWLVAQRYTNPARLAISGASNGGLLVAACMVQRPDLYGAVICQVPVIDMLRYHKFTVGRFWIPEYGSAEAGVEQFRFLYAYSPLHNVRPGVEYPPLLITSADSDDRVVPAHARKFAATLQSVSTGPNPILLRVESKAGHGLGKPITKVIDEQTDIYTFLFMTFGMTIR